MATKKRNRNPLKALKKRITAILLVMEGRYGPMTTTTQLDLFDPAQATKDIELLKLSNAPYLYGQLKRILNRLNFDFITYRRQLHLDALRPIKSPDILRAKVAKLQDSYEKTIDDYHITVRTSYIKARKGFSKTGYIWIVVTKANAKRPRNKYIACFERAGNFPVNVSKELEFIVNRLFENRPVHKGIRADIYRNRKGYYEWVVRKKGKIIKRFKFYENLPQHLAKHVYKRKSQKMYYEKITRPTNGTVKRVNEIRIPYEYL